MNLRRAQLFLLLILVTSLIFEMGEAKRKNKGGKKRKKNKKKLTTTTAETTTEFYQTTAFENTNPGNTSKSEERASISTSTLIPSTKKQTNTKQPKPPKTTSALRQDTTEQENAFNVANTGLMSIIDSIFDYDENYSYEDYTETTSAPVAISANGLPYCESLGIRDMMTKHFINGTIKLTELLKLKQSDVSPEEQIRLTNETLIRNNLPPLKPCVVNAEVEEETTTTISSTKTKLSTTSPKTSTTASETTTTKLVTRTDSPQVTKQLPTCESLGIRAIITRHFILGEIQFADINNLRQSKVSPEEKIKLTNATLIKHNLPPLKPCIPKSTTDTSIVAPFSSTTTKLPTTTSTRAPKTSTPTMTSTSTVVKTSTTVKIIVPAVQNIPTCDTLGIPAIMTRHLFRGEIPHAELQELKQADADPQEKLRLTNATLIRNNLPPLKPCVIKSASKAFTTEQASTSEKITSRTPTQAPRNTASPSTTTTVFATTTTSPVSANPQQSDACDAGTITQTLLGYVSSGQIPGEMLQKIADPNLSNAEKLTRINKALSNAGLPLIECGVDEDHELPTATPCELVNITDHGSLLALVRDMEEEEQLPDGTYNKLLSDKIAPEEAREMVMGAAVNSGRFAPDCAQLDPPTPRVLGSSRLEQLNKLQAIIKAGYLPPDTLTKLALGEITKEWLRANLSKNEDYILSQMPDAIAQLVRDGHMPPEIVAEIFGPSPNKTKIILMMIEDDDLIKQLLPEKLRTMLGDKPVPTDLKILMLSGKNETEIRAEIENNDELLQQMMSPSSWFFYNLFKSQTNRTINAAISITIIVVLMFVMTSLGCTMTVSKIAEHAKRPKGVIIALVAQFIIMPASAYALTVLFKLKTFEAIAVLICGCCPGGNLSNMLSYALNGDMNLSILMTTCSSIIGLGMMPLSIFLYSQLIVPLGSNVVPYEKIIINIACTILPVLVGVAIRHYRPQWTTYVMRFGAFVLIVCTITIATLSGIMLGDAFFLYFNTSVLACCAILPLTGYTLGYVFAFVARENPKCRRTICVETGCQNVQLCSTVLKLAFDPVLVGVLFLMPLVYMAFQTAEAFLMILIFRLYNRCRNPKKVIEEENDSEEKKKLDSSSDKGSSMKDCDENHEKKPLTDGEKKSNTAVETTNKSKDSESDIVELWPLDNTPSPGYLDSFKAAGTENYV